jgi:hypothetical protein
VRARRGLFVLIVLVGASCGRKGPPLPPLRPLPNVVAGVSARRVGDRIELRFVLPANNQDGSTPAALGRVEVYARSVPEGSPAPTSEQLIDKQNLVGSVSVRPPESDKPLKPGTEPPQDDRPAAGDHAMVIDRIPAGPPAPLPAPRHPIRAPLVPLNPSAASATPAPPTPPTRYVAVVPFSPNGHAGRPSQVAVPLTDPPAAPIGLNVTYD